MALTLKEFNAISKVVKEEKLSSKDLLELLKSKYTNKNPIQDAYTDTRSIKNCLSPIKKTQVEESETRKREIKKGFKVMTPSESSRWDKAKGAPEVGN